MSLHITLVACRLRAGLSQSEVAREAHISRSYLHRLEKCEQPRGPSVRVLARLAEALGVPLDALLPDGLRTSLGSALSTTTQKAAGQPVAAPLAPHGPKGRAAESSPTLLTPDSFVVPEG